MCSFRQEFGHLPPKNEMSEEESAAFDELTRNKIQVTKHSIHNGSAN